MDNKINSSDLDFLRSKLISSEKLDTMVDVNCDGSIDIRDLVRLHKILTTNIPDYWIDNDLGEQGSHDIF